MYEKSDQQSYSHVFFIAYRGQEIATELLEEVSQPALREIMSFYCCNPKILWVIRIADPQIKLGIPSDRVFPFRKKCQKRTCRYLFELQRMYLCSKEA